jgi:drug/metabolite transporter (DMT)-like permease
MDRFKLRPIFECPERVAVLREIPYRPPALPHLLLPDDPLSTTQSSASSRDGDLGTDAGLLVLTLIWGVNFAVVKGAMEMIPAMAFNALRFPLASLVVYGVLRAKGPLTLPRKEDLPWLLLLGVAGNGVYQIFFIHGLDRTTAGNSALLLATVPVWTALLSSALGEGKIYRAVKWGIGITFTGILLIIGGGQQTVTLGGSTLVGDGLALGSAILWSLYTVGSHRLIARYGSVAVTAWTLWLTTLFLVPLGIPAMTSLDWQAIPWSTGWGAVVFSGVLALGLSYLLWYRGVQKLGSARTAAYSNLVPVVALITAWAALGEVPAPLQALGAGVVLTGIILARLGGRKRTS